MDLIAAKHVVPFLSACAKVVLRSRKPMIIGITGTAGKSTLTELLGLVLGQEAARPIVGTVAFTTSNMNGDYGLPLTVLRRDRLPGARKRQMAALLTLPFRAARLAISATYPRVLVLEYGTFAEGHLHDLTRLAPPAIGIVTTIGPGHLDRLGSVEGVYEEKRALVQAATRLAVLGDGHQFVSRLEADATVPVQIAHGRGIELSMNIARIVCSHLNIPDAVVEAGLANYRPPASRLETIEVAGIRIIDDSFNANPIAMELALDTLSDSAGSARRKVAVLGAMAELGSESIHYHQSIGAYARERADIVIGVGDKARDYQTSQWFATSRDCAHGIAGLIRPGDVVLVKGSHSTKMRLVVEALRDTPGS